MPTFTCTSCRKIFTHKGAFDRHQNRKYPCFEKDVHHKHAIESLFVPPSILCDTQQTPTPHENQVNSRDDLKRGTIPKNMIKGNFEIQKINFDSYSSSSQNQKHSNYHDTIPEKNQKNVNSSNTILCIYCQKYLKNRVSFNRHVKICKRVPINSTDKIDNIKTNLLNDIVKKTTILPQKNSNITQNIINNTINKNNQNIQNIQNIIYVDNRNKDKILPFGKEDIDYLSNDLMKNIIMQPEQGIIKLIQQVHFNDNQPQNKNIQIVNKKEPYLEVFNGEKWEKQDKKIAIQNMITTKKDIMDDYFDEQVEKNIISTFIKKNYETFSDMLDDYVRESLTDYDDNVKSRVVKKCLRLYREICKQAEILLINNKIQSAKKIQKNEKAIINHSLFDSDDESI